MGTIGRRRLLESAGMLLAAGGISAGGVTVPVEEENKAGKPLPLQLKDFEPRSMLHMPETKVERSAAQRVEIDDVVDEARAAPVLRVVRVVERSVGSRPHAEPVTRGLHVDIHREHGRTADLAVQIDRVRGLHVGVGVRRISGPRR